MTSEFSKWIDNIIGFTELAAPRPAEHGEFRNADQFRHKAKNRLLIADTQIPLSHFGAVRPLLDPLIGKTQAVGMGFFKDVQPRDVSGKWDISTIQAPGEDWGKDALYQLIRTRRIPLSMLRGTKVYSEYVAEQLVAVIFNDGTYRAGRLCMDYVGRDKDGFGIWASSCYMSHGTDIDADGAIWRGGWVPVKDEDSSKSINAALGLQFTEYYEWNVTISAEIGIPVRLATDPEGARKAFAERNKPASGRRESLKNWISQHWRAKRPDKEVFVREHLRGMEQFEWCGFDCRITPSEDALHREEKLIRERKEMKREGKTVRLRQDHA